MSFARRRDPCFIVSAVSDLHQTKVRQPLLLHALGHSHGHGDSSADHGVVAHAQEAHHLHVGGDGAGTGELGVGVHPAHRIGHAVGSGAGGHVVGVAGRKD